MGMTVGEYILSRHLPLLDEKVKNVIILRTDEKFVPQGGFNPLDWILTIETDSGGFNSKSIYDCISEKDAEVLQLQASRAITYARQTDVLDLYILIPKEDAK